jgi:hypothetical protein
MAMTEEIGELIDLGLTKPDQQELFGDAFLTAVASVAGCAIQNRRPDNDSIDWTLNSRLSRRPKLDIQMKTTSTDDGSGGAISYPLKRKNYDDLILMDVLVPRILVLVTLPDNIEEWLSLSVEELVLRRCGYWVSLAGNPESDNVATVTVYVPRVNLLTPHAIQQMMSDINDGVAL